MPLGREKMTVLVLLVIVLEVVDAGISQKLVSFIHLHTKRVQYLLCLLRTLYNGLLLLFLRTLSHRKNGKIMLQERIICSELHHLRVNEDELQLCRMLCV